MKKYPPAILLVTKTTPPSVLPLSLADLNAIINGLDLLASQIEFTEKPKKSSLRKLEAKLRKAVA